MHPAFEQRSHQQFPSVLPLWLDLEASSPNAPFEFFVPDIPGISDGTLEAQLTRAMHGYITASIHFRQAQLVYGQCLAKIARRKAAKKRQLNSVSAIFRFPDELLSDIFQFSSQPILSSHVCHRWRAIAIDTPSLWCDLTRGMKLPQANTFLKRSRNRPLTICTAAIPRIPIHRVKKLDLMLGDPADIQRFHDGPATLLELISIETPETFVRRERRDDVDELFNLSLFSNQAPSLKEVRLQKCILINFPTQSVTKLVLTFCFLPKTQTTIHFLQSIPALQCLALYANSFQDNPRKAVDCHLPSLQRLCVDFNRSIKVIAPNLEDLAISASYSDGVFPQVYPGSSLRRLRLQPQPFTEQGFRRIHAQLQDVQALEIGSGSNKRSMENILAVLSNTDRSNNFRLPLLNKLFIHRVACTPPNLAALRNFIQIRQVTVASIHPAYMRGYGWFPDFHEPCCPPLDPVVQRTDSELSGEDDEGEGDEDGEDEDEDEY